VRDQNTIIGDRAFQLKYLHARSEEVPASWWWRLFIFGAMQGALEGVAVSWWEALKVQRQVQSALTQAIEQEATPVLTASLTVLRAGTAGRPWRAYAAVPTTTLYAATAATHGILYDVLRRHIFLDREVQLGVGPCDIYTYPGRVLCNILLFSYGYIGVQDFIGAKKWACAALAGGISAVVFMPIDVIRTRMQSQLPQFAGKSFLDLMRTLSARERES
jgi:hypothetical protein